MEGMSVEMRGKIDDVLKRVKEPETGLSVWELNLVKRVSYSDTEKKLLVVMDIAQPRFACMVCGVVTEHIRASLERMLKEEFKKEFPELTIETA